MLLLLASLALAASTNGAATAAPSPAAAPVWHELQPSGIGADTWLRSNWNKYEENYHPNYAFDDDPATAWVEGREGAGEGANLYWRVSPLASARTVRLTIRNGYQKSAKLLDANAAPASVTVSVGAARVTVPLARTMGWQEVLVPIPAGQRVEDMNLHVATALPGKVYSDLCISDIKVYVDSDVPYDAAVEAGKREALLAWKKGRLEEAKAFAALPASYPWASTSFVSEGQAQEPTFAELEPLLNEGRGRLLGFLSSEFAWKRLTTVNTWKAPDGVMEDKGLPVQLADVAFFDATAELAAKGDGKEGEANPGGYFPFKGWWRSNYRVRASGAEEAPTETLLYWWQRQIVQERGTYDTTTRHVAAYDAAGRLQWHYQNEGAGGERLERYTWSAAGKITRVERVWAADARFAEYGEDAAWRDVVVAAR